MAEDDLDLKAGERLFAYPAQFMMGAVDVDHLPPDDVPEVAFAGRSNVGKSSLINALCNERQLARASSEPGRTRELNFFDLSERLRMVDLPGYGFARAGKVTTKNFQSLSKLYLRGRVNLKRAFLLIDSRHGIKSTDIEALDALDEAAVSYQIIATKGDKIGPTAAAAIVASIAKAIVKRPAAHPRVILTSASDKTGLDILRAEMAALALPPVKA
jgi:GTP-binding protein